MGSAWRWVPSSARHLHARLSLNHGFGEQPLRDWTYKSQLIQPRLGSIERSVCWVMPQWGCRPVGKANEVYALVFKPKPHARPLPHSCGIPKRMFCGGTGGTRLLLARAYMLASCTCSFGRKKAPPKTSLDNLGLYSLSSTLL